MAGVSARKLFYWTISRPSEYGKTGETARTLYHSINRFCALEDQCLPDAVLLRLALQGTKQ